MVAKKKSTGNVLDQDEVMKAMLAQAAAAKQVGGDSDSDGDGGSGSDDDDDDESGSGSGSGSDSDEDDRPVAGAADSGSDEDGSDDDGSDEDADGARAPAAAAPAPAPAPAPALSRVQAARTAARGGAAKPAAGLFDAPRVDAGSATFASLGLSAPAITALAGLNIRKPTEIQVACVPAILAGRDCIGGAKTGSGKTLAFALPLLETIARDPFGIYAVVLTPTRELAYQLAEQFMAVGRPLGLTTATVVGGMDMLAQAQALERRPHVVVATPGRLCDLLRSDGAGANKLARVRALVLDEADRMLTPTFAPELAYLFGAIPKARQTLLFTATISDAITDLAKRPPPPGKQPPFVYRVPADVMTVARLTQKYLFIPSQVRDAYLYYMLVHPPSEIDAALRAVPPKPKPKADPPKRRHHQHRGKRAREDTPDDDDDAPPIPSTIIFAQKTTTAHVLHLMLNELGIPSVALHSGLTQPERLLSLARFRARDVPVLVTTDVGSRGLDVPEVALVINWDCPRQADDYVHRVGRTARAGRGGVAVTIITERDTTLLPAIEKSIGTTLAEWDLPEDPVLENLNKVATARRLAGMEMHDSGFGERKAVNKAKAIKRARRDQAKE